MEKSQEILPQQRKYGREKLNHPLVDDVEFDMAMNNYAWVGQACLAICSLKDRIHRNISEIESDLNFALSAEN